ncbi:hypothetical protein KGG72_gp62 [Streptomyces phage Salutena]|uniref:Uncharacterized protein n=1 Tax=Streptomyces phage Salutena TaxID=2767576 RepID=A0A7S6U080_9CAUD|nr:hypothetical protein KGG72_gp62 [Streptomyces phage Salutena]QOV06192.1 hypothetical protein CPT_Salutena_062 [Streptomyces phage Salutena]
MPFQIGERADVETYRMRSVPGGYPGDLVQRHSRVINGKRFEFARIQWGTGEVTVTASPYNTTEILHDFVGTK